MFLMFESEISDMLSQLGIDFPVALISSDSGLVREAATREELTE